MALLLLHQQVHLSHPWIPLRNLHQLAVHRVYLHPLKPRIQLLVHRVCLAVFLQVFPRPLQKVNLVQLHHLTPTLPQKAILHQDHLQHHRLPLRQQPVLGIPSQHPVQILLALHLRSHQAPAHLVLHQARPLYQHRAAPLDLRPSQLQHPRQHLKFKRPLY